MSRNVRIFSYTFNTFRNAIVDSHALIAGGGILAPYADFKSNDFKTNDFKNNLKPSSLFVPNQQDTLFWCFYIMKNGDTKYEMLPNKNSLIAKQIKIELISTIRNNKDII